MIVIMSEKNEDYRFVVFADEAANYRFLTRSTVKATETTKWEDGKEYPLVRVQISSASHPFFTGEEKIIDTEGRVDRFKSRAARAQKLKSNIGNKVKKAEKEAAKKVAKAEAEKKADSEKAPAKKADSKEVASEKKTTAKKADKTEA